MQEAPPKDGTCMVPRPPKVEEKTLLRRGRRVVAPGAEKSGLLEEEDMQVAKPTSMAPSEGG